MYMLKGAQPAGTHSNRQFAAAAEHGISALHANSENQSHAHMNSRPTPWHCQKSSRTKPYHRLTRNRGPSGQHRAACCVKITLLKEVCLSGSKQCRADTRPQCCTRRTTEHHYQEPAALRPLPAADARQRSSTVTSDLLVATNSFQTKAAMAMELSTPARAPAAPEACVCLSGSKYTHNNRQQHDVLC